MTAIHFAHSGAHETACGIDFATEGTVAFTSHKLAVTCPACQKTRQFADARQRIPTIPGPLRHDKL